MNFSKPKSFVSGGQSGVVLIIVLAGLVLLSLLVVAFMSNVGTELKSSRIYANGASVKLLSQTAVNLVQSEINDATHDGSLCWTSQPGMIRTFDNTGRPVNYFKLYSDDTMVNGGSYDSAAGTPPADWFNRKGVYVDLNQPVTVLDASGTTVRHYPIVDGDANDLVTWTPPSLGTGAVKAMAPLSSSGAPQISGYWIQTPNDAPAGPKKAPLETGTINQAPMPVKWLYVLRDGSVLVPDSTLTNGATVFTGQTPDNDMKEIVGRIAFWTDDETSKVNLNTAAEGTFADLNTPGDYSSKSTVWDTPRFRPSDYSKLSTCQPVQNEFQRYPGHPATVSLSAVFGNLITDGPSLSGGLSFPENVYPLTPRIQQGGSKSGTISLEAPGNKKNTTLAALELRTDRLYDTVDEFMFQNNRAFNSSLLNTAASLDQTKIEKARFFLTTCSRAPDVNLFNRPRISVWPVSSQGTTLPHRSPKDQLIAFCSTINNFGYYFQRQDPNDPDTDLPASPGLTGLGRNRQLLEYLRNEVSRQIPGFGGSFSSKYNSPDTVYTPGNAREIDQILTEIFDYIRCTNIQDQSLAGSAGNPVNMYAPAVVPGSYPYLNAGSGQVVPIVDSNYDTRGFGRFPTIQQAALIFYASKDDGQATPAASQATEARAFFVLQGFDPAMGYPVNLPYYTIRVSGLSNLLWDSSKPGSQMFATDSVVLPSPVSNGFNLMQMCGGLVGWRRLVFGAAPSNPSWAPLFSTPYPAAADNPSNLPYSPAAPAGLGLTGIRFKGGPITVEIYQKKTDGSIGKRLQSIKFTLPDAPPAGFPLPALSDNPPTSGAGSTLPSHRRTWENWSNRWGSPEGQFPEIISKYDVIRSVVASPGDMRLIAARSSIDDTVTKKFYDAHPRYSVVSPAENMAHALAMSNGQTEFHASMTMAKTGGMLVALTGSAITNYYDGYNKNGYFSAFGNNYGREYDSMGTAAYWSDVPTNTGVFVGGSGTVPGDWDNGVPSLKDGAYINKADEGDTFTTSDQPYFENSYGATPAGQTFFSPNRMIPSPAMLGSLPTGVLANRPWQTLLFRPGPAGHPGLGTSISPPGDSGPPYSKPPDHLLLEMFHMPVVEPYAISEPLATAGRINMNYQIVPFTWITRNTGMQAALRGVQMIAVPDADASIYKYDTWYSTAPTESSKYRMNLDIMKTLTQFEARFNKNDVFRSPAEICSIDLVPANYTGAVPPTRASMDSYWSSRRLTGDNTRERPYANLYPLLTTKSNTFTVHFRVQTLKKLRTPGTNYAVWKEGTDLVTGEYRGSQTIERYVDANNAVDPNGAPLPNFADPARYNDTLNPYYKFRVVSARQFAP